MKSKLDALIKHIQEGDIPEACQCPLVLVYTQADSPFLPGTIPDTNPIVIYPN